MRTLPHRVTSEIMLSAADPIVRWENWERIPSFKICASERTTVASRNEREEKLVKSPAPGDYSIKLDPRLTLPHGGKFANPNGQKVADGAFDRAILEAQAMPGERDWEGRGSRAGVSFVLF